MAEDRQTHSSVQVPEDLDQDWLDEARTFHPIPRRAECEYCAGRQPQAGLAPLVDATYCISLKEESFRAQGAAELFHAVGLCRDVTFYRPSRGRHFSEAVWASHREVARHALERGARRALILEDDVDLPRSWPAQTSRIRRSIENLPEGWWGFFLGYLGVQGYFVRPDTLRVRAMYTHAYIADEPLLRWLAETEPMDPRVPIRGSWGIAIDSAFANLPHMYALFPLVATQRFMGRYRFDPAVTSAGARRKWLDPERLRYVGKFHGLRPAEVATVLLSPLHRFTLESFRSRNGKRRSEDATVILASALFDDCFYRAQNPDVVAAALSPIVHFIWHGAREGRNPHPLFDTSFYLKQSPGLDATGENPLAHFVRVGASLGRDPHPAFDTSWYVEQYGARLGGQNPLRHFMEVGVLEGCNPNPDFDCASYLARHPDVRAAGLNPLVHHLSAGRGETPRAA